MTSKQEVVVCIREWLKLENEMSALAAKTAELRKRKKTVSLSLMGLMRAANVDQFDNIQGGTIFHRKTTKSAPLTRKTLLATLQKLYQNEPKADEVLSFIMENRGEKTHETIEYVKPKSVAPAGVPAIMDA